MMKELRAQSAEPSFPTCFDPAPLQSEREGVFYAIYVGRSGLQMVMLEQDARTWVRRMEADQEALGETGARLAFTTLTRRYMDAYDGRDFLFENEFQPPPLVALGAVACDGVSSSPSEMWF